jgi:hypothetical protein
MIDFVNCFLELLADSRGTAGNVRQPLIDPVSGVPTGRAFRDLLRHELDPNREGDLPSMLLMLRLPSHIDLELAGKILKHRLRADDVLVPLGRGRIGMIVYAQESHLEAVITRLKAGLRDHRKLAVPDARMVGVPLRRGDSAATVWQNILRATRPGAKE